MERAAVVEGREAYDARRWATAYRLLSAADEESGLEAADLMTLATAAYLSGHPDACIEALSRAFHLHRGDGAVDRAAGCAYWLAFALLSRGEHAQAGGWVARAMTMLDEDGRDCVERGYLQMLGGIQTLMEGDPAGALAVIDDVEVTARRFDDLDLIGLSGLGKGQALIALDRTDEGLVLLDQVMVSVTAGELSETIAGLAYCAIISTCQEILDVRRAREWTAALTRWCADQPDLVPYSGHCLVHRSEIHQLQGNWDEAAAAVAAAHQRYELGQDWSSDGLAYYCEGELFRLRGRFEAADAAFREASRRGHDPQPGLALLRLAQGQPDAAATTTGRLLREPLDRLRRAKVLVAHIEVMLAGGDVEAARLASDELTETAAHFAPSMLRAVALGAEGAVVLAEGDAATALAQLRQACALWQELDAPYELARTRELIGLACRDLGDQDTAELELHAAAETYRSLGAEPDLLRVADRVDGGRPDTPDTVLTARELEVLRLVAAGKTNRAIAQDLVLSEKTVARHLSNIFVKLDLPSRSAATAYAYEHDLV
jgi:DNA-binding NarL/FixJ family response regulator